MVQDWQGLGSMLAEQLRNQVVSRLEAVGSA